MNLSKENQESLIKSYLASILEGMTDTEYKAAYEYTNLIDAQTAMDLGEFLYAQKHPDLWAVMQKASNKIKG